MQDEESETLPGDPLIYFIGEKRPPVNNRRFKRVKSDGGVAPHLFGQFNEMRRKYKEVAGPEGEFPDHKAGGIIGVFDIGPFEEFIEDEKKVA